MRRALPASRVREVRARPVPPASAWAGLPPADPAAWRERLRRRRALLDRRFKAGAPIGELLAAHSALLDELLRESWVLHGLDRLRFALLAVGGYGRAELNRASDIDLLVLLRRRPRGRGALALEKWVTFLWDMGLEVGHQVTTPGHAARVVRGAAAALTSLLEARPLIGDAELPRRLAAAVTTDRMWSPDRYLRAKLRELEARHLRFRPELGGLEPDVKEAPGGLRDLQTLHWVALRCLGRAAGSPARPRLHWLNAAEREALRTGGELLQRLRYALHLLAGRAENRLLFQYQPDVARLLGYRGAANAAVERCMRDYYHTAHNLEMRCALLLEALRERCAPRRARGPSRSINRRFRLRAGQVEVRRAELFRRAPWSMLEALRCLARERGARRLAPATSRALCRYVPSMNRAARADDRTRALFMELVRGPGAAGILRLLHRYRLLGACLPYFGEVEGRMQFDLFHAYTVDEHSLRVVEQVGDWLQGEADDPTFPLARNLARALPRPELLLLAALFHDLGKGRGGDHSVLGADAALDFCRRHGLSEYDARLVAWLVRHHLVLSHIAQRADLDDDRVIHRCARLVGDRLHLEYLLPLTVADIRGTHPNLWNDWKAYLLELLYQRTLLALRRGLEHPLELRERCAQTRAAALALLPSGTARRARIKKLWDSLGEEYFLRYLPGEIAWHARAVSAPRVPKPLVLFRSRGFRGGSELFIYMPDQDHIFSTIVNSLDRLGMNVADARVITAANAYTLDSYTVLEREHGAPRDRRRALEVVQTLRAALGAITRRAPRRAVRRHPRRLRHFPIPTTLSFTQDPARSRTILELTGTDRPGLLCSVGNSLQHCGVRLGGARIATYGERVQDFFFIRDRKNRPLTDPRLLERLRRTLLENLGGVLEEGGQA